MDGSLFDQFFELVWMPNYKNKNKKKTKKKGPTRFLQEQLIGNGGLIMSCLIIMLGGLRCLNYYAISAATTLSPSGA